MQLPYSFFNWLQKDTAKGFVGILSFGSVTFLYTCSGWLFKLKYKGKVGEKLVASTILCFEPILGLDYRE